MDVTSLTDKFWQLHADSILTVDCSSWILANIQLNLAAGTLAPFAEKRPELRPLLRKILNFDVSAQFLLTELAHGLDAPHLETTATLLPTGMYDLHTPRPEASKFMPPTAAVPGLPRVAIVIARLVVEGEDRGVRPFIVSLADESYMCKGITSRLLPGRPGTEYLDHAITTFNHVILPGNALLGDTAKPANERDNFLSCIHRVGVGSLAISLSTIPALSIAARIVAQYSFRRTITNPSGSLTPIWNFRTQQLPVLRALAHIAVMKAFARETITFYRDVNEDPRVVAGVAACVKAVMVQHAQAGLVEMSDRCGAQGLFLENQIIAIQSALRGVSVAEGDTLALCIRLASELLLARYKLPAPRHPECLLARHEAGLFAQCRTVLQSMEDHRSEAFNRVLLPMSRPLVEAIGHRMAYEAALDSGCVDPPLLQLYEATVVKLDGAWYAGQSNLNLDSWAQHEMEERAATEVLPLVERHLERLEASPYANAPIVSVASWNSFCEELETFKGDASANHLSSGSTDTDKSYGSSLIMARL